MQEDYAEPTPRVYFNERSNAISGNYSATPGFFASSALYSRMNFMGIQNSAVMLVQKAFVYPCIETRFWSFGK